MNTTPIEFMAWDKNSLEIITDSAILEVKLIGADLNGVCDYELMQLTALRSINDEPIYNHMIVKNKLGIYQEVNMFNYHRMSNLCTQELEIVGNRFQHPELLN